MRFLPGRGLAGSAVAMETADMAAPAPVGSVSQRLERALSTESSITTRTPGHVVSPVSLDLRVSPGQVAELPGKNLWEQICEGRQPGPAERGGTRAARWGRRFLGAY
ncbi:hypothetical protein J1605_006196 [Eschrichtius robustus]|uniref:Uncharacterized protein n=1 Tax=Eschrichtius robustus TaxID=9764 RepID=A0AB34H1R1_ESCRO|nr:hypothetical protein J1605_006196 [Eschrichtius robustus]